MGETDALAGLVLRSGAAEQVENALMVLGVDAAAVVGHLEDGRSQLGAAADGNIARHAGLEVLQRIIDEIGEYLLQRQPVADNVGQRLHAICASASAA